MYNHKWKHQTKNYLKKIFDIKIMLSHETILKRKMYDAITKFQYKNYKCF